MNKTIALLGGAGFIGTNLTDLLLGNGWTVRIGDIRRSDRFPEISHVCDVCQESALDKFLPEAGAIVNLAAEHRDDVRPLSRYTDVNVTGAVHVCRAASRAGIQKIIFTSSVAVYGFQPRPVDEAGPFAPFNEYGRTKLEAEKVYRAWAAEDPGRTLVIVRPTVVFGEGNRGNVYNLLHQIASGRFLMVGSGANIKSMAYVGNVAAFLAHVLTLEKGVHTFNYVDAPDMNTRDLVAHVRRCLGRTGDALRIPKIVAMTGGHVLDLIARVSGRTFPISAVRVRKFCENTQFQATRAREAGFTPPFTLSEGLERTIKAEFSAT